MHTGPKQDNSSVDPVVMGHLNSFVPHCSAIFVKVDFKSIGGATNCFVFSVVSLQNQAIGREKQNFCAVL